MNNGSMSWISFLPFVITLIVATGGWLFTYFHARYRSQQEVRLKLVNDKLRLLYGPLYARLLAGNEAWSSFSKTKWPKHGQAGYFADGYHLTEEELATWRHWMRHVFHPMNKKLEAIIVDHMDLVEDDQLPKVFTDVLAHIHVYDAVIKAWDEGDFSAHTSVTNFPAHELMHAVEPIYKKLRSEQATLSGMELSGG
ncbi:hypothetical protein FIU89_06190 [Roseovarius sp. THAF27]|uniref:hypothetical protein n=1 Tax=Roseovarius sp. THAF27 TaxID=2587850 RepID=UPI001268E1EF|nr:hypothetical protein [Roseovarius sp. THAF27]QFT80197.1 hypothetical protein FIU89_06190 [Roseovarius sp. THAF27]